jgi:hypothetical protein
MSNYESTKKVTDGLCFKDGKVFDAVLNIMNELNVPKNGVELDKDTGEVKYRYIKIGDLREALQPLLITNKCMIRKIESSKFFRDRKQNKYGTWVNIDVIENSYIFQSLEDGSFIIGTGRGEGSDWGDSSVTLAEADAFKNFIGNTFCLVTDDESEETEYSDNTPVKKRKRRTKAEIEADKAKAESEVSEKTAKEEPKIVNPAVKLVAPVPTNEIVKNIDKNIDCEADNGVPVELPKEAFKEAQTLSKLVSVETVEPAEVKEKEEPSSEEKVENVETEISPEKPVETEEPTEETVSSDEEIKAYASVICPIQNRFVNGKTFEEVCGMAITNNSEAEKAARSCIVYVSSHPERFQEKAPEFVKACTLAANKFSLVA